METLTALSRGRTLDLRNTLIIAPRLLVLITFSYPRPGKWLPENRGSNIPTLLLNLQLLIFIQRISPLRPGRLEFRTLLIIELGRLLSTTLSDPKPGCGPPLTSRPPAFPTPRPPSRGTVLSIGSKLIRLT